MTAYKVHVRAFRLLFRLFFLVALPVLFRVFLSRSQLKLYLAVQCGEFGLQLFQLVLLLPHLARYLLQLRNLLSSTSFLDLYWSMMVGILSNAFRKFRAAAIGSAIARCPLL